ncbi:UNVERIFIED_CONTAM: NDR1/HIN1-like protein 13 [Sesamum indicum]
MEEPGKSQSDEKDETHRSLFHETSSLPDITTDAATSTTTENDQPLPQSPKPTFQSRTYVVQIPKDQIYRVPPPENAHMLEERTRNPAKKKRSSCCLCSCLSSLENSTCVTALQLKNNDKTLLNQPPLTLVDS